MGHTVYYKLFGISEMRRRWKRIVTDNTDHFCLLYDGRLKRKNEEAVGPKSSRPKSPTCGVFVQRHIRNNTDTDIISLTSREY